MTPPAFLGSAVESWAAFYDAHRMVSVAVRYGHLVGLVVGGGTALAIDRQLLRARRRGPAERAAGLEALRASHRVVVPALAFVALTGLLMPATDAATFLASPIYWAKMGLVALLLANGVGLLAAERAAARTSDPGGWGRLHFASVTSLVLWLAILFMGPWLTAAA
jgi:hypothetical protein